MVKEKKQKDRMEKPLDPGQKEQHLIGLAVNLAEQKLKDGTASNQIITHYLKLATEREKAEKQKIDEEVKLLQAKVKNVENSTDKELLADKVINALNSYGVDVQ